jgi:hypothetical protein
MLYARGKNDDVASGVIFCALVGSAFAMPLKYDNHLLGLVKVPRHSHPWADDVFIMSDCVPNSLFAMKLRTRLFGPLGTLPSTPRRMGICALLMSDQHADERWFRLCSRRNRPSRRAADEPDEFAPPHHSSTLSARASSCGGTVRSSAFAVFKLMTNSNCVGCWTGRSATFAPFNIRSTYTAAFR